MRVAPGHREDGSITAHHRPVTARIGYAYRSPGPHEDGRSSAAGGSSRPEPDMHTAPGPRKDGHMADVCPLTREPGMYAFASALLREDRR